MAVFQTPRITNAITLCEKFFAHDGESVEFVPSPVDFTRILRVRTRCPLCKKLYGQQQSFSEEILSDLNAMINIDSFFSDHIQYMLNEVRSAAKNCGCWNVVLSDVNIAPGAALAPGIDKEIVNNIVYAAHYAKELAQECDKETIPTSNVLRKAKRIIKIRGEQ